MGIRVSICVELSLCQTQFKKVAANSDFNWRLFSLHLLKSRLF